MCLPLCLEQMRALSRREFFVAGMAVTAGVAGQPPTQTQIHNSTVSNPTPGPFQFNRVLDLTHTLTPDFPTWSGKRQLTIERVATRQKDGWNVNCWHVDEHTGTHLDAPLHRSDYHSADRIPVTNLVGPLAVVDIRRKAAADPDAELTLTDLQAWESKHGPLPTGGIVAMCSGWDAYVPTAKFRNAGSEGELHFPGFHIEAVEFLLTQREVKGIVVDTLSLDRGISKDFPVHTRWLGSNRWGLECAANLGDLPPKGAIMVVGGPKIAGATGGPSRVLALL